MILTVFVNGPGEAAQSQAELMEHSWLCSGQGGEVLRLFPCVPGTASPLHSVARVLPVQCWENHPYQADCYDGYNLPASLLQWLTAERIDATILLLDRAAALHREVTTELMPGTARAQPWQGLAVGEGPFGLAADYQPLQAYCVNRELELPAVQLPLLIHSYDLRKLAARWLELTAIIRHDVRIGGEPPEDAVVTAFAIAAAEYDIHTEPLSESVSLAQGTTEYDAIQQDFLAQRRSGSDLALLRPIKRPGVREARVLESVYLEISSPPRAVTLNPSAGEIWCLCDGQRTLADIAELLREKFAVPLESIAPDIALAAKMLRADGAIELESTA